MGERYILGERARRAVPPAHVDLFEDRAVVIAAFGSVATHVHSAAALLVGVDGGFHLRTVVAWESCQAVLIPPGCAHQLECGTTLMAAIYARPGRAEYERLCRLRGVPADGALHPVRLTAADRDGLLRLSVGDLEPLDTAAWLRQSLGESPARRIDPRVERAAAMVANSLDMPLGLHTISGAVGLSPSRLQHLFQKEIGLTPRELRRWHRIQAVTRAVNEGDNLTTAAHRAGFVDSAHLCRAFRASFGVEPSRILAPGARIREVRGG